MIRNGERRPKKNSVNPIYHEIIKNIREVANLSNALKTSFGPCGKDKVIKKSSDKILITNDGATILKNTKFKNEILKIIRDLSIHQDNEVGDGTTGVILLSSSLLINATKLLEKGIHPVRISEGYEHACDKSVSFLEKLSFQISDRINIYYGLKSIAESSINSKIINRSKKRLSEICVKAVLSILDCNRREVNLDLIKMVTSSGGKLENTTLIDGVVLNKEFSSSQMPKIVNEPRVCLLTSPLEPPKPRVNHSIEIGSSKGYKDVIFQEQKYFLEMIEQIKSCGVNLVFCQWGFDDEANHLLVRSKISAIRWVSGVDLELISLLTGAQIVSRFSDLNSGTVGFCGQIKEVNLGMNSEKHILIEDCTESSVITLFIRGSTDFVTQEAKRSIWDSLNAVKNIIRDNRVVFGGGSTEMACSNAIRFEAENSVGIKNYILESFSDSLRIIPFTLAENSGADPIIITQELAFQQWNSKNFSLGIHGHNGNIFDMSRLKILEPLVTKQSQLINATQIANAILRIDNTYIS
mmetsp:Transcript_9194/g.14531  ORF Transcript_9194/g.14531 Transcript_9194/m.14531 type:complete len:524 (-) Transcript_9194:209-1780(-)